LITRSRIVPNSALASELVCGMAGAHTMHEPERRAVENEPL
jgi:hypothetical protein